MLQPPIHFPLVSRIMLCAGCFLIGGFAALLCAVYDQPLAGFWPLALGAGAACVVWIWTGRTIFLSPGAITLRGGPLFDTVRILRRRTTQSVFCVATPLLRLAGCRIILLSTTEGRIWLPGLWKSDANRILEWYRS